MVEGGTDFVLQREKCKVDFFCRDVEHLDYTISLIANRPASVAIGTLVREAEVLNSGVVKSLSSSRPYALLEYIVLEDDDDSGGGKILSWSRESPPMRTRAAKASYVICGILVLIGAHFMHREYSSADIAERGFNMLSIALSAWLPAATVPLPFVFEHLRSSGPLGHWHSAEMKLIGGEI